MKKYSIAAEKRTVTGKQVKKLRKQGILPVNLYGKKVASQSLQVPVIEFTKLYTEAGNTGLVELTVKGDKDTHSSLIENVQIHPITDAVLHADFHEVSLTEKLTVAVPVKLIGESPIAEKHQGVLLQLIDEVEVEALPTDIPEEITIDISGLDEIGKEITTAAIKASKSYKLVNDEDEVIVRINPLEKEEAPAPAAPAEGEAVAGQPAEGEAQVPAAEGTPPEKKEEAK